MYIANLHNQFKDNDKEQKLINTPKSWPKITLAL
jgi:hypothetical protein